MPLGIGREGNEPSGAAKGHFAKLRVVHVKRMAIIRVTQNTVQGGHQVVRARCPACRHQATFENLGHDLQVAGGGEIAGLRRCPNPSCSALLFFVAIGGQLLVTYPPETLDFDTTGLPDGIRGAVEEAVTCHANGAYVATAIMVRKTLEELCRDRGAEGKHLHHRLEALRDSVILPPGFFEGLEEVRLLGNDAAHVRSKTYEKVGKEEAEIAIAFTKEVLKAVYQLDQLTDRFRLLHQNSEGS